MPHHRDRYLFLLFASALILTAGPVLALVPLETPAAADLLLPQSPESITRALNTGAGTLPVAAQIEADGRLREFSRVLGGSWHTLAWNPVTLTPRLVVGSGLDLGTPVGDRATAEQLARAFVDRGNALFGLGSASLWVRDIHNGVGKWSVQFVQRLAGLPVIGSRLTVAMTESGRLAAFGGDLWPALHADTQPMLSETQAHDVARQALLGRGSAPVDLGARDRVTTEIFGVLPLSASEGRLVYRVRAFFENPLGAWLVDVDARSGEVYQIQNILATADPEQPQRTDLTGTATGNIEDRGWCFGSGEHPARSLEVTVEGVGTDTTLQDGSFTIPYAGTDPQMIRAYMSGAYVHVDNVMDPDAFIQGVITPGEPYSLYWDDATSRFDERDVYYHTNLAHDFVKSLDPTWTDFDFSLLANVNIESSCNAYWDGSSINFYHEAGGCANTGRIGDVIHHEYCHGITDYMYGDDDPPSDVGEGNSDVLGNYLLNESKMGRGFYLDDCENGIRDSDNDLRWPEDLQGEGHFDGQILAGFHWHAREGMMLRLGEEAGHLAASLDWHFARALGHPLTQPEQVWWTFIADDDDGIMDNGTPNHVDLCPAAERHGFYCPEAFEDVVIHHLAAPHASAPPGQTIGIEAVIYSFAGELNPDSLLVYYRELGEPDYATVPMTPTGEEDTYRGEIPNFPVGALLEYYIYAADEMQNHLTDPRQAPAETHRVDVVLVYDPFEEESGWIVGAAGDDATQGIWERCDPVGTRTTRQLQPEDDTTPAPGVACWITGQHTGGYPWFTDADGQTTLLSPMYDLTDADWAIIRFNCWFQSVVYPPSGAHMNVDVSQNGLQWITVHHVEGMQDNPQWQQVEIDISHMFFQLGPLYLRVVMYGLPQPSLDEGGIDDLVIIAAPGASNLYDGTHGGASASQLQLALGSGNPLIGSTPATLRFTLPSVSPVQLRIVDLAGRVVRTLADGTLSAGPHDASWDRCDQAGHPVGSGIYLVRLVTDQGVRTQRLVVAR